jgi:hypothetical protein
MHLKSKLIRLQTEMIGFAEAVGTEVWRMAYQLQSRQHVRHAAKPTVPPLESATLSKYAANGEAPVLDGLMKAELESKLILDWAANGKTMSRGGDSQKEGLALSCEQLCQEWVANHILVNFSENRMFAGTVGHFECGV